MMPSYTHCPPPPRKTTCPMTSAAHANQATVRHAGGSQNHACGEDSDCINRHTKMECVDGDCNCGVGCQNQRFQRKQYADVSVIKTEKKGFGLRANADLHPNDFIFEYIGEVINEPTFRSRMLRYDKEGIKHFYFMSLTKSEFVDATKKGNLGRFCNHSCNPNCYVDKWVVGQKLRMGIFAGRKIQAGEELVFNYNVDRYGADPQPCYCGERNCTGFIGGKTQTERATKLPAATIEALGIEDGEGWDTAVAKKVRKKKPNEDDQDYVNSFQPRGLEEDDVTKVMAALMQCKEKWIAVKLLARIQQSDSEHVHHRVVRMHGYQILKTAVNTFKDDCNVVLQILDILWKLPRLTKNKIRDSHIEAAIEPLVSSEHEHVAASAKKLLEAWDGLTMAYRIPRQKLDPSAPFPATSVFADERRQLVAEKETKPDVLANVAIPTGPRSSVPQRNVLQQQRNAQFPNGQRPRKLPTNLPAGWSVATDQNGRYYFYDKNHRTTWQRPTQPAAEDNQVSKKVKQEAKSIQDIIDNLTKEPTPRHSSSLTPQRVTTPVPEPKKEKWRSLSREKQMKIWENTVSLLPRACWRRQRRADMPSVAVSPCQTRHGQVPPQAAQGGPEEVCARGQQVARGVRLQAQPRRRSDRHQPKARQEGPGVRARLLRARCRKVRQARQEERALRRVRPAHRVPPGRWNAHAHTATRGRERRRRHSHV